MSDNKELLPCAHCGAAPVGPKQSSGGDERCGYNFTVSIECPSCGSKMTKASHQDNGGWCNDKGEAKADAIASWNRRAAQPVVLTDEQIEALFMPLMPELPAKHALTAFARAIESAILTAKEQA